MASLLITADDFGAHRVHNTGIYTCIRNEVLDCVDVLLTGKNSKKYLYELFEKHKSEILEGEIAIGLHFSFTFGKPLYKGLNLTGKRKSNFDKYYKKITDKKGFFQYKRGRGFYPRLCNLWRDFSEFMKLELNAQYNEFTTITGYHPRHLSSHIGFLAMNRMLYPFYTKLAKDNGVALRCPTFLTIEQLRNQATWGDKLKWYGDPFQKMIPNFLIEGTGHSDETGDLELAQCIKDEKLWLNYEIGTRFRTDLDNNSFHSTDYFIEHFFRNGNENNLRTILEGFSTLDKNSYEMVVHPVSFTDRKEYSDMEPGIRKDRLTGQRNEMIALVALEVKRLRKYYDIKKHILPKLKKFRTIK